MTALEATGRGADSELMREVAEADPSARHALALRLRPRIRRIACALLYNEADADDATQVSLMEILKSAQGYRAESSIEHWADRIAVRAALRLARERRVWSVRTEATADVDALAAEPEAEPLASKLPQHIAVYLSRLPEARRTTLVLKYAMGYTVDEIAELTATSVNTVKDRLLQAREEVRRMVRRDSLVPRAERGVT
jgi:RNA polymerase sigma-70 factor (ECF subfamily)